MRAGLPALLEKGELQRVRARSRAHVGADVRVRGDDIGGVYVQTHVVVCIWCQGGQGQVLEKTILGRACSRGRGQGE